jgi:sensor histidine kinase regulating citrate/malate metabolism
MERHMEEVEHMYRLTRGWRHDLKSHLQTMKAYIYLKEYDKLDHFLNELDTDLETLDHVVKTGNVAMDTVLNSKLSLARSQNIHVEAKAIIPGELRISSVDLSVIVGNLMDNAMEACMKMEDESQRILRVYIDVLKGQLYIYVMNSVNERPKRMGRLYQTTKNSREHGFGLLRIDKVVEKYHGYLDRQNEEGVFVTEVMLPL